MSCGRCGFEDVILLLALIIVYGIAVSAGVIIIVVMTVIGTCVAAFLRYVVYADPPFGLVSEGQTSEKKSYGTV
jgi:hypothetical protein